MAGTGLLESLEPGKGREVSRQRIKGCNAETVKGLKRKTHEGFKIHMLKPECAREHWIYFWLFNSELPAPSSENTMLYL